MIRVSFHRDSGATMVLGVWHTVGCPVHQPELDKLKERE